MPTQSPTHTQLTKVLVDLAKQYREKELELQKVQQELGVPVKLIGLGEGPDDLAPFEAVGFVDGLMGQ